MLRKKRSGPSVACPSIAQAPLFGQSSWWLRSSAAGTATPRTHTLTAPHRRRNLTHTKNHLRQPYRRRRASGSEPAWRTSPRGIRPDSSAWFERQALAELNRCGRLEATRLTGDPAPPRRRCFMLTSRHLRCRLRGGPPGRSSVRLRERRATPRPCPSPEPAGIPQRRRRQAGDPDRRFGTTGRRWSPRCSCQSFPARKPPMPSSPPSSEGIRGGADSTRPRTGNRKESTTRADPP